MCSVCGATISGLESMRYHVTLAGGEELAVDVVRRPGGRVEVTVDDETIVVDAIEVDGAVNVLVGRQVFDLWLEGDGDPITFTAGTERGVAQVQSERTRVAGRASRAGAAGGGEVLAPMPGRVVKVIAKQGDHVEAGAPMVVVEAMKMENELCCDAPGIVQQVHVEAGQSVDGGALLVQLSPITGDG